VALERDVRERVDFPFLSDWRAFLFLERRRNDDTPR
jgi:hypothetical protein